MELLATLAIVGVVAATALPSTSRTLADLRLSGDARNVHHAVGLAKMRAAARFTRERVYVDHTTNTFHLEFWDRNLSPANWVDELDPTQSLQRDVMFGFGGLTAPPANTQSALAQAPPCKTNAGNDIANTSCIVFNSRGIPLDGSGNITGESAIYLTDGTGTYGVTLSQTPLIRLWWTRADSTNWIER